MSEAVKVFYQGQDTDLIVYAKSEKAVNDYVKEPSVGKLSDTVEVFQVFANRGRGTEGQFGEASHLQLENEFGKGKKQEDVIDLILKEGKIKQMKNGI